MSCRNPLDARGVPIAPGDTAIFGFGVGRSVAMAEAVVLGEHGDHKACLPPCQDGVSLTASGRVRLRVVRRSYGGGEKPVVDVAPDRLVVLKPTEARLPGFYGDPEVFAVLPSSPLPTQAEERRHEIELAIESYTRGLRATAPPGWWGTNDLGEYHTWCASQLEECRRKLRKL